MQCEALSVINWSAASQLRKCHKVSAQTPKIVYLIEVEGTAPHHTTEPLLSASHA